MLVSTFCGKAMGVVNCKGFEIMKLLDEKGLNNCRYDGWWNITAVKFQ